MGIFSRLFGGNGHQRPRKPAPDHAVIVHFQYGQTDLQPIFDLEDRLEEAISQAGTGEFDGHDVAIDGSDGHLHMYGPDGDRLFQTVRSLLESTAFIQGATVRVRYGPPEDGVREIQTTIGT